MSGERHGLRVDGNFYPDFMLWLTVVDPKGLRNLDLSYPKLGLKGSDVPDTTLATQVKAGEATLVLIAFVLSPTKFADLKSRHVLFMEDGGNTYLKKLFALLSYQPTRHGHTRCGGRTGPKFFDTIGNLKTRRHGCHIPLTQAVQK